MMKEHEYLELLFQSFDAIQTGWGIFTTVVIGILAAVVSFPKQLNSILARTILIFGFFCFAWINRTTVVNLAEQRCELRVAACEIFGVKDKCKYDCGKFRSNSGLSLDTLSKEAIANFSPQQRLLIGMVQESPTRVEKYHWLQTAILILIIWMIPRHLIKFSPERNIVKRRVKIRNSIHQNPLISYNQVERMWEVEEDVHVPNMYLKNKVMWTKMVGNFA